MAEKNPLAAWLELASRGDRLALQRLLVVFHERLLGVARRRMPLDLKGRLEAEDLLQQTYVRVLCAAESLQDRGPEAFFTWLKSILASVLVDAERAIHAQKRDHHRELSPPPSASSYDAFASRLQVDSLTPSRVLAARETRALLMAALAGLTPDHREVLELRFLKGLTLETVAARMERSRDAVQMLSARAARRLREALRDLTVS